MEDEKPASPFEETRQVGRVKRDSAKSYCITRSDKLRQISISISAAVNSNCSAVASQAQADRLDADRVAQRRPPDLKGAKPAGALQVRTGSNEFNQMNKLLNKAAASEERSRPTDLRPPMSRPGREVAAAEPVHKRRLSSTPPFGRQLITALLVLVAGVCARLVSSQQYKPDWPQKVIEQEIFLLNLEDGYFGCQVNASQDFLQLFELSRLCDGQTQCYLGSDELESQLKCRSRDRCEPTGLQQQVASSNSTILASSSDSEHVKCVNGVCLDGLCYCNDGFGGKSCDIPDENECKFRPCDVFAHCTNTMGSYYCSCFPGYDGDGMRCQDINECEIPSLRALCSDNSECVNLPGHFVCKCKPGYQQSGLSQSSLTGAPIGNATVQCTDIDECSLANTCGRGAQCENLPGSYRCACPPGFSGDPAVECIDMDECRNNPCGIGAQCTNIPGGFRCSCAPGHERNPSAPGQLLGTFQLADLSLEQQLELTNNSQVACLDVNECLAPPGGRPVCGSGAQCVNTQGGYFCQCPPGFSGNPKVACLDDDECQTHPCGPNAVCTNVAGSYKCDCRAGFTGNAYLSDGCHDEDECLRKEACGLNAQCFNTLGGHQCTCLSGYAGDPNERCSDIDECATGSPCGPGAQCQNFDGGYKCSCPEKYLARGTPEMGCERAAVDIGCTSDFDCTQNAQCLNTTCQCKPGFQISGIECVDVDECSVTANPTALTSTTAAAGAQTATVKPFTRLSAAAALAAAAGSSLAANQSSLLCGPEASCHNLQGSYRCDCKPGYEKLELDSAVSKCRDIDECERSQQCGPNSKCFNTLGSFKCLCNDGFVPVDQNPANGCKSPCDGVNCGQHATCKPHGEEAACVCKPGFTFDPNNIKLGCVDINECDTNYGPSGLCGQRATCTNVPGSYRCHCPSGFAGDAYRYCEDINECDRKFGVFGQCGELAVCSNKPGGFSCSCGSGYTGDPYKKCQDVDECASGKFKCGANAICTNTPGKYTCQCPANHSGDPNVKCVPDQAPCSKSGDCARNEVCQSSRCSCPFAQAEEDSSRGECKHPCEKTDCGEHATCQLDSENQPLCVCDAGFMAPSDGRSGCVDVNECIQGVTLSGVTPVSGNLAVALGPNAASSNSANLTAGGHPCGRNALCRNQPGSFDCICPAGYTGDAYVACNLDVRSQTGPATTTSTTTTSNSQQQQTSTTQSHSDQHSNYQQEPRTSSCSEVCGRGHVCADGKCVKRDSCHENADCLSSQACEHVNQALGFQCVNVCDGLLNQCGPNARCLPSNHKPICSCNSTAGFAGNPYDLVNGCRQLPAGGYEQPIETTTQIPLASVTESPTLGEQKSSTRYQDLMEQRKTTISSQQQGDISTVFFDYANSQSKSTTGHDTQQVSTSKFSQSHGNFSAAAAMNELMRQQVLEQQPQSGPASSPALVSYELPLPTTPSLGQSAGSFFGSTPTTGKHDEQQAGQNRSGPVRLPPVSAGLHKQQACTSDLHCPGNLFCLAQSSGGQFGQPARKSCECPAEYRREGDLCFMQRINCTDSAVCRPREECARSQTLTTFAPSSTISQQFAFGDTDNQFASGAGICICPRGFRLTPSGSACVDRNECDEGTPCALGAICQNKVGSYECVCPPGTTGEPYTKTCEPVKLDECRSNLDCAADRECDLSARKCVSPCHVCGPRAICTAADHSAICLCPPKYTGNAIDQVYGCQEPPVTTTVTSQQLVAQTTLAPSSPPTTQPAAASSLGPRGSVSIGTPSTTLLPPVASSGMTTTSSPLESTTVDLPEYRTIPPSELFVMCLADGIHVDLQLERFDGIIYVKGHSQDPKCRKLVSSNGAPNQMVDFKVQFGHCDLIHRDGEAAFVLVIQKHPKLVTYRARAYHVKCVYNTGERTVTLGFNVSMITTSGTIANTGLPPTCLMSIAALDGREVTSAEIGQDLLLRVDVQPDSIYGGFARSCEAKTADDEGEYRYEVTDANGCATDPSIFSDWKFDEQRKSLVARFNAFKFPSSNNLRFQCNIRVCFGSCPPANCNGIEAYGKRRRRRAAPVNATELLADESAAAEEQPEELPVEDTVKEGALREEVMVQSNAILTFDKKEESSLAQRRPSPVEDIDFVCLPRLGIVMSITLTSLLGLLAVAIAGSCWCFAKRKRHLAHAGPKSRSGPLPHPASFQNPLMRSTSSLAHSDSPYDP